MICELVYQRWSKIFWYCSKCAPSFIEKVIDYRVIEGSFKFEKRENCKAFELQKTPCALPAATREGY
jgi:hypothetical protein